VLSAAGAIAAAGGQLVVSGTGEAHFERALKDVHRQFPSAVGVDIGFDEGEARRIFAGTDFTLMPSRFEPCGLSQMYAQRFGSLPIGHETGLSRDNRRRKDRFSISTTLCGGVSGRNLPSILYLRL